jgi:hypothetical protein
MASARASCLFGFKRAIGCCAHTRRLSVSYSAPALSAYLHSAHTPACPSSFLQLPLIDSLRRLLDGPKLESYACDDDVRIFTFSSGAFVSLLWRARLLSSLFFLAWLGVLLCAVPARLRLPASWHQSALIRCPDL